MHLRRVAGGWISCEIDLARLGWENLLTDSRPIAVYTVDGSSIALNDAMQHLLGWPIEDIDRRGWIACLYPDPDEQEATLRNAVCLAASSIPRRHSRTVQRPNGSEVVLDMVSSALQLPDGRRGVFTIAADATHQGSPIGGDRSYRELVEDAPDILTRTDAKSGRIMFVNRAIEPVLGYTTDEVYAEPILYRKLILPEYNEAFDAAVRAVLRGEPQWMTIGCRRKNGEVVSLHQAFYPIRDASGRVVAIEGVARDMTAVRTLERQLEDMVEALRARNEELSSLDRLKSQLLANVSHELRTPLVTIKGYNELILRGSLGPVTARQRRALEIAAGSTERLADLIESLLDFGRLEEGRLTLRRSVLDARIPMREAIDQHADRIAEKGLELVVSLGQHPLEVDADHGRLAQVFKALLSNAEKFCTSPGEIRVTAHRADGQVLLGVRDTGIGIPRGALCKIFDRFYQVDSSMTRKFGGAGLGLALAREIVALHGGEITVASEEGRGSTFTVRLPALESAELSPRDERPVLLVAASSAQAPEMRERLEAEGLVALEAHTGADLVRRARRHRPDAIVLSLDEDLGDTIQSLHADAGTVHIPIIAMTDDARREELLPLADYMVRRNDWARLTEALRRLLGREPPSQRHPCVLVIDDEPEIVDFTRFVLEREGLDVVAATSGAAALEVAERSERPFDLIILDLALDGLLGIELCRKLKSLPHTARVPVLMVTASSGNEVRHGACAAGAEGFLVKPFGVEDFLRQVRLHIIRTEGAPAEAVSAGRAVRNAARGGSAERS